MAGNGDGKDGNGKSRIWVAVITSLGVIIAAVIGIVKCGSSPAPDVTYSGRVINKRDQSPIKGASVSVFFSNEHKETFTGDNGVFSFTLSPQNRTARLSVRANGYSSYDSPVFPLTKQDFEDIRLEPVVDVNKAHLTLPEGKKLVDVIKFAASKEVVSFGTVFIGNCNPKLMQSEVRGGEQLEGKDMGDIIEQFKSHLVNPPSRGSYNVTKLEERKVYQIECTN